MSTRIYDNGFNEGRNNPLATTAARTASTIDNRLHWGADTVAGLAHQAAAQIGHASDYLWNKSGKLRHQVSGVTNDHPLYTLFAVGLMGFGLGFLLRGGAKT